MSTDEQPERVHSPLLRALARTSRSLAHSLHHRLTPASTRHPRAAKPDVLAERLSRDPRVSEATLTQKRAFGASLCLDLRLVLPGDKWDYPQKDAIPEALTRFIRSTIESITYRFPNWGSLNLLVVISDGNQQIRLHAPDFGYPERTIQPAHLEFQAE